eukprot:2423522-Pyramimonas_sp.AAC.1
MVICGPCGTPSSFEGNPSRSPPRHRRRGCRGHPNLSRATQAPGLRCTAPLPAKASLGWGQKQPQKLPLLIRFALLNSRSELRG